MEMKIGSRQIRSSFSKGKFGGTAKKSNTSASGKRDGFVSSAKQNTASKNNSVLSQAMQFGNTVKQIKANGTNANFKLLRADSKDYESRAKNYFTVLDEMRGNFDKAFPEKLKAAGVPANTEFEFDYNIDTRQAVVTKISDEKYRGKVEELLNHKINNGLLYTAYASRIMNGNIASAYYSKVGRMLESNYGQDIKALYADKNGKLCGANEKLKAALNNEKSGNTEALIKRLITDENITPNVSHMGYGRNGLYADDGDFKIGGKTDMSLFADERYAMRGTVALYIDKNYDLWLNNEEKF